MLQSDHDRLLDSLGARPKKAQGIHDWAPPVATPYCRKCGAVHGTVRALRECDR